MAQMGRTGLSYRYPPIANAARKQMRSVAIAQCPHPPLKGGGNSGMDAVRQCRAIRPVGQRCVKGVALGGA